MSINYQEWMNRLGEVSSSLMEARTLSDLLSTILSESRHLTRSDAGSIYRVEPGEDTSRLIFEEAQNDSVELSGAFSSIPIDRSSLAGYAAAEGEILNIPDVYKLPPETPYSFDPKIDEGVGYRTQSMLVIPLKNREGTVRGVLQLINRKADEDVPIEETSIEKYPENVFEGVRLFADQAAIAIERAELDESIQSMIQSIIQTLVNTLDQRDKITTGHSIRTASYGYHLARAINESDDDSWSGVFFENKDLRRLYYAGLLHDIGKITVPESILNKENRLPEGRIQSIFYRLVYLEESGQYENRKTTFDRLKSINETGYLEDDDLDFLDRLRESSFEGPDGGTINGLTETEYHHLSIKKGNLTSSEFQMMEDHAQASYDILRKIAWTENLENIPTLASSHHERLDGSGYPWGKTGDELNLISKILAVVDVYDALTARDRPYRSAMDHEEARNVLEKEAQNECLEPGLIKLFFEKNIAEKPVDELPNLDLV